MKPDTHIEHLPGIIFDPNYHPAEVKHDGKWRGKQWNHMPGGDEVEKKLDFALFRRGLLPLPKSKSRKTD